MAGETIKAGRAWWEITAEDRVTKTIDRIADRLAEMGRTTMIAGGAIAAVGTAIVGPVVAAAKAWSDYAGDLEDTAMRTGVTVEAISTLNLVAGEQGASAEALAKGLIGVAKFTKAVSAGSKEAAAALAEMGISSAQLLAASPDERIKILADGLARVSDPTKRATLAMTAFGKSGFELLPMLALGGDGIAKMQDQFAALGLAVPSKDIGMFASFGDDLATIGKQVTRAWHEAGAALIEAVGPLMAPIKQALAALIEFTQANRTLVRIVLAVGAAMVAIGTTIFGVGAALAVAGSALGGLAAALPMISTAIGAVVTAFGFLMGPIGLAILAVTAVIAVLTAAGVAFVQLTDTGAAAWASLTKGIMGVWERFREVIGAIGNALLAGEWALAVDIAWAGVMLVFAHNLAVLEKGFWDIAETLGDSILWGLRKVEAAFEAIFGPMGIIAAAQDTLGAFADEQRAAADAGVAAQRAELDKLIAAADAARARTKQRFDFSRAKAGEPDTSGTTAAAADAAKGAAFGVLGTFSATVAGMLGTARVDVMETIAAATERSADTLDRIEDKIGTEGVEFE